MHLARILCFHDIVRYTRRENDANQSHPIRIGVNWLSKSRNGKSCQDRDFRSLLPRMEKRRNQPLGDLPNCRPHRVRFFFSSSSLPTTVTVTVNLPQTRLSLTSPTSSPLPPPPPLGHAVRARLMNGSPHLNGSDSAASPAKRKAEDGAQPQQRTKRNRYISIAWYAVVLPCTVLRRNKVYGVLLIKKRL